EPVGFLARIERATGGDDVLELALGNRDAGNDASDASRLLVEVPDELATGRLLRVAPAIFGENRDPRAEERHLVRRDDPAACHELQNLRRIGSSGQHREPTFDGT